MKNNILLRALLSLLSCAVILISCSSGGSGGNSGPNTVQFNSDRIHVEKTATGELVIRFTDANNQAVEVQGVPNGSVRVLYDQNGIQVVLTADGNVQLVTPYTNALGSLGTGTYTVYNDFTAIEVLDADGIYDYRFYFADSGTGSLAYEAKIADDAGQLKAIFNYPTGGSELGRQNATMTYNADSSRGVSFSNPYGSGRAGIAYTTPLRYADVAGTAFYNTRLHVYVKTDGKYIVDYYAVSGKRMYSQEVDPTVANPNLYQDSAVTLSVLADNTLKMVEPAIFGIHEYALNPSGLAAEHDSSSGENVYAMHFMDAKSGQVEDTGMLTWYPAQSKYQMDFAALIYSAPVVWGSDFSGNIAYDISYNHAQLGHGMFQIFTDAGGVITSTLATITTPHP